jgi:hypothetical protein
MVLRQHSASKLHHLFLRHQSIFMPPKSRVRCGKIVQGHPCAIPDASQSYMQSITTPMQLTDIRMVLGQHSSQKLQHLFPQHQSIFMPPKIRVRAGKSAQGLACTIPNASQSNMQSITTPMQLTDMRMVLRQHSSLKLQHPFPQHQSIFMPPKIRVRESKIVHGHPCAIPDASNSNMQSITAPMQLTDVGMVLRQHSS